MSFHDFIQDPEGWKTVESHLLFANPYLEVFRVGVTSPTRSEPFEWTVAHRKGAVVVVPITAAGEFLLVRQERVPIRSTIWEFPAGQIDQSTGHNPEAILSTGLRELREESGYEMAPGGEVTNLGYFFPSAGFTDEHSHLILVRPVVPSALGTEYDEHEAITGSQAFTGLELRAMIASGEIRDSNTLASYARLVALGLV